MEFCWEALEDFTLRILLVCGIVSLILGVTIDEHPEIGWIDGFAIILAVVIVVLVTGINDYQKQKKFIALQEANSNRKEIEMIRDAQKLFTHPSVCVVGDLVVIKAGMHVPADGILISGEDVQTTEAEITGENDNIKKDTPQICTEIEKAMEQNVNMDEIYNDSDEIKVDHKHDIPSPVLLSGTQVIDGRGLMLVLAVGDNSCEGRIKEFTNQEDELTPLQKKLNKVANDISKAGLVAAVFAVVVLYLRFIIEISIGITSWSDSSSPMDLVEYFVIGITVLVVAIPEGLPLAVTIALAYSVLKMQKEQNLVRRLHACETMGGVDSICSDKTGTLTQNKMDLVRMWLDNKIHNYGLEGSYNTGAFSPDYFAMLKEAICCNSTADLYQGTNEETGEPELKEKGSKTEVALLKYLRQMGHTDYDDMRKEIEHRQIHRRFNFTSTRKRSSFVLSLDKEEGKLRVHVKGAAEVILDRSSHYLNASGEEVEKSGEIQSSMEETIKTFNQQGLRSIVMSYRNLPADFDIESKDEQENPAVEAEGLVLIAIVGIKDPIRPDVPESVEKCKQAWIKVRMVTGDNTITARAIAEECHILEGDGPERVMEGDKFYNAVGGMVKVCRGCKRPQCHCEENKDGKGHKHVSSASVSPLMYDEIDQAESKSDDDLEDGIGDLDEFEKIVQNLDILARSRPADKYLLVTGLRHLGHVVAVTGDGSNDAPALAKADIGFAMGIEGTDLAKESAGIILLDDNFSSIIKAVVWGRNIYDNIRKFIQFQLTVNVVAVSAAIVGAVLIKQSPLTAVQMLWVNLIMDTLASLALATEPPREDLLLRPPQDKDEYIVSKKMWKHIFGQAVIQCILVFLLMFYGEWFLPEDGSGSRILTNPEDDSYVISGRLYKANGEEDYVENQKDPDIGPSRHFTYLFNIFVILQLFNEWNSRKIFDEMNICGGIGQSFMFLIIWIVEFILQIVMVQFGGLALKVHLDGLTAIQWLICFGFGVIALPWRYILIFLPLEK